PPRLHPGREVGFGPRLRDIEKRCRPPECPGAARVSTAERTQERRVPPTRRPSQPGLRSAYRPSPKRLPRMTCSTCLQGVESYTHFLSTSIELKLGGHNGTLQYAPS